MNGDALMERGAMRLRELSAKAATRGGVAAKLATPLAEDAQFLARMKPSLVRARMRGEERSTVPEPAMRRPQGEARRSRRTGGGPNPLLLAGAALGAGAAGAKLIDWRGHAHPRS